MISGPRSGRRRAKRASRSAASKPWRNRISYFQSTLAARSALVLTPPEKARAYGTKGEEWMLKIWGRNTSSNVQKVMWAIGELGLEHERVDIGGQFRARKEHGCLARNPHVPGRTLTGGALT